MSHLYRHPAYGCDWAVVSDREDFGIRVLDLVRPPLRFWGANEQAPPVVLYNQGARRLEALPIPTELLSEIAEEDNWQAMTRRSLLRLAAWFLIAEDPQRRLDQSDVASLAHQASLVRHVAHVYEVARAKLELITFEMASPDRSEAVFARVMALVPPDELLQVMGRGPLSPLSDQDRSDVERLVTAGHERWSAFDRSYRSHQQRIRGLEPGQATWDDVGRFATKHLGATKAEGYQVLRFVHQQDEVIDASENAEVVRIGEEDRAIGDYGGMPITGPNGAHATLLGLNSEPMCSLLEKFAFGEPRTGAAHVRWPDHVPLLGGFESRGLRGFLFYARQTLRLAGPDPAEISLALHGYAVYERGVTPLEPETRAQVIRALLDATVRQRPEEASVLVDEMRRADAALKIELMRPTEVEIETQLRHVVFPLLAAVVG